MKKYSDTKIKELIKDYPELLDVLNEYKIPCATCTKHNCSLKEVTEAENLSMKEEQELMTKISNILSD